MEATGIGNGKDAVVVVVDNNKRKDETLEQFQRQRRRWDSTVQSAECRVIDPSASILEAI